MGWSCERERCREHARPERISPPAGGCPDWCAEGFHAFEPDGDEYKRTHQSANLASAGADYTLELYRVDYWVDGRLQVCEPIVIINDEVLTAGSAGRLAADLADALR